MGTYDDTKVNSRCLDRGAIFLPEDVFFSACSPAPALD
jgi:hypothetical protein